MPGRGGCRNGSPAPARCRRRRATTSRSLPALPSRNGRARGRGGQISDRAAAHTTCQELMALLKRAPNYFVSRLEQSVQLGAAQPWGVQLAGGFNRDLAMAMYSRAMAKLRGAIGDQTPTLLSSQNRNRGMRAFYQVRIGADTRQAADDLCNRIRRAGGACFVLRNMRGMSSALVTAHQRMPAVKRLRLTRLQFESLSGRLIRSPIFHVFSAARFTPMAKAPARVRLWAGCGSIDDFLGCPVCHLYRHRRAGP